MEAKEEGSSASVPSSLPSSLFWGALGEAVATMDPDQVTHAL